MATEAPERLEVSFAHQLGTIVGVLRTAAGRKQLVLLVAAILATIVATAVGQVKLNAWNQPFYDAIERKDLDGFLRQLGVFFAIVGVLLILNVTQTALNQLIKLKLREIATQDLLANWMKDRRAARISRAGEIGVNPDQRMHADAQHLSDLTTALGVGLFQACILLVSFIGVLWVLSEGIMLEVGGRQLSIPGYMVWAALIYAAGGSLLSWQVARPLVRLEMAHYAREADLRVALVRGAEQADDIALNAAEPDMRRQVESELARLLAVLRHIVVARIRLTFVTSGYGWAALVVPIIVAAPGYFGGRLSFGELMMVVGAFRQVQNALGWFVDNTDAIADWRATLSRVMRFRQALHDLDRVETRSEHIVRSQDPEGRLTFRDLKVNTVHGTIELEEPQVQIGRGERVLLVGRPRGGKSTLFLAIAGLWDFGSGRIGVPNADRTMFLSQRPYVPFDSLRNALTYGGDRSQPDVEFMRALERVGLSHLCALLDTVHRWDRELTLVEQERLGYARMLLRRPEWLICDDGFDPSNDANRDLVLSILKAELCNAAVVNIASGRGPEGFYSRIIRLVIRPAERVG